MVKLTEPQARALACAKWECDKPGNYAPYSERMASDKIDHIAEARQIAAAGLLVELGNKSGVFTITPAGRAWLAEKEKKDGV